MFFQEIQLQLLVLTIHQNRTKVSARQKKKRRSVFQANSRNHSPQIGPLREKKKITKKLRFVYCTNAFFTGAFKRYFIHKGITKQTSETQYTLNRYRLHSHDCFFFKRVWTGWISATGKSTPGLGFAVMYDEFSVRSITVVQIFDGLVRRRGECLIYVQKLESKIFLL